MPREITPYPRPYRDPESLLAIEISNGSFRKATKNSLSQSKNPLDRYINLDDSIVDRLSRGERTSYDIDGDNEVIDMPKIKEWSILPYYIDIPDGKLDIVYDPRRYYRRIRWQGRIDYQLSEQYEYAGSPYNGGINSGFIFMYRPKVKSSDSDYIYKFGHIDLLTNETTYSMDETMWGSKPIPCDGFSVRSTLAGVEIITHEPPFIQVKKKLPNIGTLYGYGDHFFNRYGTTTYVYDRNLELKATLNNVSPSPRFYWKDRYFFLELSGKTTVLNAKTWEQKTINKKWSEYRVMGLYDFYEFGAYRGARYKYNLRKYGTWTPDLPVKEILIPFDQYGDFQKRSSTGSVIHTYDFKHFLDTQIKFTLPCDTTRFLNIYSDSVVGYFGKICLSGSTVSTELFELLRK